MSHNLPHHDQTIPDRAPSFSGRTMLWMIEDWKVVDIFVCSKKMGSKISQRNRFRTCEKSTVL